jgi:hypothetical protein
MGRTNWRWYLAVLLCLATVCAEQAAKESRSGLAGEVLDTDCGSLQKARIMLVDLKSLQTQTTESAEDGTFAFPAVKPGGYAVIVTVSGPCYEPQIRQMTVTEGKVSRVRVVVAVAEKCGPGQEGGK